MGVALRLMEQLHDTTDETERTRLIVHAFEALEERYPQLSDVATQTQLSETELRLKKEIKQIEVSLQKEIKQIEVSLQKENKQIEAELRKDIENIRLEIKQVEVSLRREIENTRLEIKQVEVNLHQAITAQTRWMLGGLAALATLFKLLSILP
ncbi:MAG: hypothetical protein R8J84_08065 [Mariprofundales bacterium]